MKLFAKYSLSLFGLLAASNAVMAAPTIVPSPPSLGAKGYVLMDFNSGEVLVENNAHTKLNPASLTKLMTSYVAGQEMKRGNISADDKVRISENAWAKKFPDSSKMFIEVNTDVAMMDLYRGLIIQSGNDASVAIAEHVAGSQDAFVDLMNSWAASLKLENTHFANAHGLDAEDLYSTPYDIALLGRAIIRDLPEVYGLYSERSFSYNGITQHNRNGLLRDRSLNVDGMKTGYTSGAGYSLASSATQGEMRLIAVVMGASSIKGRESDSKQLLSYGFRFFDTLNPHQSGDQISEEKLWFGEKDTLKLGVDQDTYITLPKADGKKLSASVELTSDLKAPIEKGQTLGVVHYTVDGEDIQTQPLVALESVEQGSFFKRILDHIKLFFASLF
ncbi:D-alanyl-D-alanine carboxypeptidase [Vibrio sp. D404a]|uniref:D-alanyl-D-alanine carboxypeptidase family protein n=1 Tax=unclassified Vibrio TaxID=2614977 RepID=UPI0025571C7F|nr:MULTISPECIES: D-alanyl-D-alanine carboxypeptidase family protein [unclassified Vibrio]MDK9738441.1 D-alanyl-D-alanine carboxypeptidase [Vibrio sp. D404a]MDK9796195.1 D-alanyl-D-alanine carboxypeptidase [Vibrio sp. D449a]